MTTSLGRETLRWARRIPSPADPSQPLILSDGQAEFIVDLYEEGSTGRLVNRRGALMQPKGWGKSPLGGLVFGLGEFAGPASRRSEIPLVQIAALSEDQASSNVYSLILDALTVNHGKLATDLGIEVGRLRLHLKVRPAAVLEPVTSSAGSREGQRVTAALMDETHLWDASNGGQRLARTIRRNLAKTNGRSLELFNAYEIGRDSVAEQTAKEFASGAPGILFVAGRCSRTPEPTMGDEELLELLAEVYAGSSWVDTERVLRDVRDPGTPWGEAVRYFFNVAVPGGQSLVDPRDWAALEERVDVPPGSEIALGFSGDGSIALVGCTMTDPPHLFTLGIWERDGDDWKAPREEVVDAVEYVFERYKVRRFLVDKKRWPEAEDWATEHNIRGVEVVVSWPTSSGVRMGPAYDRLVALVEKGGLSHSGNSSLSKHVEDAVRKGELIDAVGPGRAVTGAKAAALALEARVMVPAKRESAYARRGLLTVGGGEPTRSVARSWTVS